MFSSVPASSARYWACGVKWIRLHLFLKPAACCGLKRHQQRKERERKKKQRQHIVMGAAQWAKTAWIETQGNVCPFSLNLTLRLCYQAHTMEEKYSWEMSTGVKKASKQTKNSIKKQIPLFFLFCWHKSRGCMNWSGLLIRGRIIAKEPISVFNDFLALKLHWPYV